jgi:two-component system, OmpR family, phosphate regulon response regulator PhoB
MPAILIVDDEYGIAEMSAELLSYLGYAARTASDGASALTSVDQAPPDLILLDVMMPVVSGIDVLLTLKADARHRAIPVVMMSAAGAEVVPDELRPLIAGFLLKPFTFDELKKAVRAALPEAEPEAKDPSAS